MTKARLFIALGFAISIFAHLILINIALELYMKWDFLSAAGESKLFAVQQVQPQAAPTIKLGRSEWSVEDLVNLARSADEKEQAIQNTRELEQLLAQQGLGQDIEIPEEELEELISLIAVDAEELEEELLEPKETTNLAQEVLAIEEELFDDDIKSSLRRMPGNIDRGFAQSDFITIAGSAAPTGEVLSEPGSPFTEKEEMAQLKREASSTDPKPSAPSVIGRQKSPRTTVQSIEEVEIPRIVSSVDEDVEKIRKYPSLDDLLRARLYTYQDPDESQGFFMVVIEPRKDREKFEVIPKDIVFVIDSSRSILQHKLDRYLNGLKQCLKELNQGDRFNIIEFKDYLKRYSEKLVFADEKHIRRAARFIDKMISIGETDIYRSFSDLVLDRPSEQRPYIIFFISDGRATAGLMDNRKIINRISAINANRCAIYTFAGGMRINRYLLDMLAYRNKGNAGFEAEFSQIDKSLQKFYHQVRYPLLINLRYRLTGINEQEIYPKALPDFFYHSKLVLVGRYSPDQEFSMQILGQVGSRTKEFIFKKKFSESDDADPEVARVWAFKKIYYLIGRMAVEGQSPDIIEQIQRLAQKYNVRSPY